VRDYAAAHGMQDSEAVEAGLHEKAKEFTRTGSSIYHKA